MINFNSFRYALSSYLKFLWQSTNAHGIHSPFVYDLVTKCFYDQNKNPNYQVLDNIRKELTRSNDSIQVLDFGAGSREQILQKSQTRRVNKMLSSAATSAKRQKLLLRLVQYLEPINILELGTHLGMGTLAMKLGAPKATITSIEGCPNTFDFTKNNIERWLDTALPESKNLKSDQIKLINSPFAEYFEKLSRERDAQQTKSSQKFDLIYLDGHHDGLATLKYFEQIKSLVHQDSLLIIDDIHWSKSMTAAWHEIIKDPQVTVSIDTYFWGLIFFRKEQAKEDFRVRI
ncbi:class I SAM-dependent methyltransferase [Flavobacteriaceae bacterium]|nr:class I SAM-dependent methyltransferase [Flavobacteriaceae bacterium]